MLQAILHTRFSVQTATHSFELTARFLALYIKNLRAIQLSVSRYKCPS